MKARSFSTGSVQEFILWRRDLNKILKGQNVVQEADMSEMAKRVLEGDALTIFEKLALDLTKAAKNFDRAVGRNLHAGHKGACDSYFSK